MRAAKKLGCNTGHTLDTERVPQPRRLFPGRVPYKSFVIIDLIEIDTAPEGTDRTRILAR
jgi:hypothetical protein